MAKKIPQPMTLRQWRAAEKNPPPRTPILMSRSDIIRIFGKATFQPDPFPHGTSGILVTGIPGGRFVGLPGMCVSEPGLVCWSEPKIGGRCTCAPDGAPIPGTGPSPKLCSPDRRSLKCTGACGHGTCRYRFSLSATPTVFNVATQLVGSRTMLGPTVAKATEILEAVWPHAMRLWFVCTCET